MTGPNQDYKLVRAWCKMLRSHYYYTDYQLEMAREEKAPETAVYRNSDGGWVKLEDCDVGTQSRILLIAEYMP